VFKEGVSDFLVISFCCCASLSSLHTVCQQCWKWSQVHCTKSLSLMRSMILSELSSFSDNSNSLLASNLYIIREERSGVEVSNFHNVISNGDEGSRFGGRMRVIC